MQDTVTDPDAKADFEDVLTNIVAEEYFALLEKELARDLGSRQGRNPNNRTTRLSASQIVAIYRLHLDNYPDNAIGQMYGIAGQTVANYLERVLALIESSEEIEKMRVQLTSF